MVWVLVRRARAALDPMVGYSAVSGVGLRTFIAVLLIQEGTHYGSNRAGSYDHRNPRLVHPECERDQAKRREREQSGKDLS
jgi:hypothetical protein